MADKVFNVLFLCTGNSARSIMAEAVMNQLSQGRFHAYSAGSHPRGEVHPLTLRALHEQGYPVDGLSSKGWEVFSATDAPAMDFVFTVCDQANGEVCPVWPGQPMTAHWGFDDPARADDRDPAVQYKAFTFVLQQIVTRLRLFLSLPLDKVDRLSLQHQLHQIGGTQAGA